LKTLVGWRREGELSGSDQITSYFTELMPKPEY
jgi:hypothetical protein